MRCSAITFLLVLLGCDGPSSRHAGAEPAAELSLPNSGSSVSQNLPEPRHPPPPPPPHHHGSAADLPEWETKAIKDPQYSTLWSESSLQSLHLLLTSLSEALETLTDTGNSMISAEHQHGLETQKTLPILLALLACHSRTESFPDDFLRRMGNHLKSVSSSENLGVWAYESDTTRLPQYDFSALAAWMLRDDARYFREFMRAKQALRSWPRVVNPRYPRFTREKFALAWLVTFSDLTAQEAMRLELLRASTLGDQLPDNVSIAELLSEYEDNEVRADSKYKGHVVELAGAVGDVKRDVTDSIYVTIGTGKHVERIQAQCFFDDRYSTQLALLRRGERVRVLGRISGLMMNVLIQECELAETSP
jgi:hypothetical protein